MKKIGLLFVTVIMLMLFAVSASAERYWYGIYPLTEDNFAYEIINEEAIIRGYAGSDSKVIIPAEIKGYPVTTIGAGAFQNRTGIVEVSIPNSVTTIEDAAFYFCEDLKIINISENINNMGFTVFQGTAWYNNYKAGDLIYIGNVLYEFKIIFNAKYEEPLELIIRDGTKCIAGDALRYLTKTTTISIPDSVEFIGQSAFNEIESLKTINMGKGVKTISKYAFVNNNIVTVNYNASKLHWDNIRIDEKNEPLLNATIIFNEDGHSINTKTTHNPTCTESGYTTYLCSCGEVLTGDIVEKTGHTYNAMKTEPTCIEEGYTTNVCECGFSFTSDYISAKGHDYKITTIPATHLTQGSETFTCICGDSYAKPIDKLDKHTYNVIVTQPTCIDKGYTTYTCECGDTKQDNYTSATGHKYDGQTCVDCGKKCSCNCHKSGFMGFIWKITLFFNKLFKTNRECACGIAHY